MLAHRVIVGMIIKMHIRHRQPVLVFLVMIQGNAIGFTRHVFAHNPQPCCSRVGVHVRRKIAAPASRVKKRGIKRQTKRDGLQFITANKTTLVIMAGLILYDAGMVVPR